MRATEPSSGLRLRVTWRDLIALFAFVALAVAVHAAPINAIDLAVTHAVQRLSPLDAALRFVSWFGYSPIDRLAPPIVIALLLIAGWRRDAIFAGVSVIGSWLLDHGVKLLMTRPRPDSSLLRENHSVTSSFPSGHVMQYVALFGAIAMILHARQSRSIAARALRWIAIALVVLVGPSRIFLGAHWASDVTAGYLLAGWWLFLVARYYRHENVVPRTT